MSQKIKLHKDVTLLPVDQINHNNWNPNFVSTAMARAIRDDIQRNGFIGPIVVQKHNQELNEDYVIINGEHRYDAFVDLKIGSKIPATILDINDIDAKVLTLRLNREHGELMPDKVNTLLSRVRDALPEDNQDELYEITGMSEGDIKLISSLDIADISDTSDTSDSTLEVPTDPSVDLYLQWSDIENAAKKCAEQLQPFPIDQNVAIIGIANGGIIPAKLISELIEQELVAIMPKGPSHTIVKDTEVANLGFRALAEMLVSVDRIIIVDDIYDKGKTHKQAIENIKKMVGEQKIEYVALVSKPDPAKKKIIAGIVTNSKQWVVFPWEKLRENT
jgi:hypoxanthine phosphoribosyltransferase